MYLYRIPKGRRFPRDLKPGGWQVHSMYLPVYVNREVETQVVIRQVHKIYLPIYVDSRYLPVGTEYLPTHSVSGRQKDRALLGGQQQQYSRYFSWLWGTKGMYVSCKFPTFPSHKRRISRAGEYTSHTSTINIHPTWRGVRDFMMLPEPWI